MKMSYVFCILLLFFLNNFIEANENVPSIFSLKQETFPLKLKETLTSLIEQQNENAKKNKIDDDQNSLSQNLSSISLSDDNESTRHEFEIKCCKGSEPRIIPHLKNFTFNTIDDNLPLTSLNCRNFYGFYTLKSSNLIKHQVSCDCPVINDGYELDKNCRFLPNCKNGGLRYILNPKKCNCKSPFFSDLCENFCDHGKIRYASNGRQYCDCKSFFEGIECRKPICFNNGQLENGRCSCPPQFIGNHCEFNRTIYFNGEFINPKTHEFGISLQSGSPSFSINTSGSRFQRFGDQVSNEMLTRDISGTIFSLIMIIVLVVSMYLLMKHRMQARYLNRQSDLLSACTFPTAAMPTNTGSSMRTACRVELMPSLENDRQACMFPFRSLIDGFIPNDGGPPPYITQGQRGRRNRDDILPPLPTYEDATKLPPLRQNINDGSDSNNLSENIDTPDSMEMRMRRTDSNNENNRNNTSLELISNCHHSALQNIENVENLNSRSDENVCQNTQRRSEQNNDYNINRTGNLENNYQHLLTNESSNILQSTDSIKDDNAQIHDSELTENHLPKNESNDNNLCDSAI